MDTKTAQRNAKLRSLTEMVASFDPSDPVHFAHFQSLKVAFGEIGAAMLVSQDAARAASAALTSAAFSGKGVEEITPTLELTDPGAIGSHPHWRKLNRVVRHGEKARYTMFDFDADTKVGGRLIPMFTRDQTVPAYAQED